MTRRLKIIAAALIVLGLGGLGVILLRDWSAPLRQALDHLERQSGLSVVVEGKTRVALLPPSLTVEKVRVRRGDADWASIARLSLRLTPGSILSGKLDVRGIAAEHLRIADLELDRIEARLDGTRLDGFTKLGSQAITFSAALEPALADGKIRPASLRLTAPALGASLRFDGSVEQAGSAPLAVGRLTLTSGEMSSWAPGLGLPTGAVIRAEADVEAGAGQISLVNLVVSAPGSKGAGSVQILGGSPPLAEIDLDIDQVDLAQWLPKTAKPTIAASTSAESPTPAPTQSKPTESKPTEALSVPAAQTAQKLARSLDLPDMLGNVSIKLGRLRWQGQDLNNLEMALGLDAGGIILRHGQVDVRPGLRLNADGVWAEDTFKGRLRLNGPGLSGRADMMVNNRRVDLTDLRAKHDDVFVQGRASAQWGDTPSAEWSGEIGAWRHTSARLRLTPRGSGVDIPELALRVGDFTVDGKLSGDWTGARPLINADLALGDVDMNALPGSPIPTAPIRAPKLLGRQKIPAGPVAPKAAPAQPKGASPFGTEPLDWSALTLADGTVSLKAKSLKGDFGRLDLPELTLTLKDGTATVDRLKAGLYGGVLKATGQASAGPLPGFQLQGRIEDLDLARLKPTLAGLALTEGKVSGQLSLTSFGKSQRDMAANAQGEGRFDGGPGTITGVDLAAINTQVARLENIGNLLTLAQTGLGGGTTAYTRLSGEVAIRDGTAHGDKIALVAKSGSLDAEGSLNLPAWTVESAIALRLAALPATPLTVRLSGPVGDPRKSIDANALQKALVESGLGKALSKGLSINGDGVGSFLRAFRGGR